MAPPKLLYRPEIDGLRAVAVISVVLYHAQMRFFGHDWFAGGYIGVDIFFVISGYLLTRIIIFELQQKGTFSFFNFYVRRARRILPVLFIVIFVSAPFAWRKLLPADFVEYSESIFSALSFIANFFFYHKTVSYGAESAQFKPFLHTWSLGVEEQFYLFFPVFVVIGTRLFARRFLLILLGLCLLSLQLAEVMVVKNATFNFYSPLGRLWEFGFGASLAYCELHFGPSRRKFYRHCLPLLGVGLIGYSILIFDGRTPHPSLYTTLPILGVGLVISFSSMSGVVGRVLSSKLLVWIGLLSYSIYLWHFPIFAFARMGASFSTTWLKAQWILLTMLASVVSYFLVEKPFRNQRQVSNWWFAALLVFFAVPTLIGVAIARESGGLWQRFNRAQQEVIKGFNEAEYGALSHPLGLAGTQLRSGELTTSCRMRFPREACRFGNEKVVYLGDSFVGQYERALVDSLKDWGLGFISFNYDQCPFVSDQVWFGIVPECSVVNEMRRNIIQNFDDKKVFIISANENQFAHPKKRTKDPVADGRNERIDGQGVDSSIAWESYFENIRWLVELGHKVVLIRAIPPSSFDGRRWLADNVNLAVNMNFPTIFNDTTLSSTLLKNHRRYQKIQTEGVIVINPSDVLCDKVSDRCMDVKQGYGPLYDYPPHLSYLGAALVAELIESKLVQHGWLSRSD